MNFFVTGTDTDVGKTYVSCLWLKALRKAGIDAVGMKPITCGDRTDAEQLHAASGQSAALNDISPIWLRTPAAPYAAGMIENRSIDLDQVRDCFERLRDNHSAVIVEGAGGWLTPIRKDFLMADLAEQFGLPVVVVVRNRLGALNHTLLTVTDLRRRGLHCAGLIFNNMDAATDAATTTNRALLEDLLEVPVLFEIERDQQELLLAIA